MTSNVEAMRHYQVGIDYHHKMQFERASREYQEAVRLDPQFAMPYFRLWWVCLLLDNQSKADEVFGKMKRLQANFPREQQLQIASLEARSVGDFEALIRADEAFAREMPIPGLLNLAVDLQNDDPNRAVALAHEAMALEPSNPHVYNEVAYVEAMAGHEPAALAACDRYRVLQGANEPNVWDTRSNILFLFGRDDEAAVAYRHTLELDPAWTQIGPELALIYADQGKHELAVQELLRFQAHPGGFPLAALHMFESQLEQARGRPEDGLKIYTDAIPEFLKAEQPEKAHHALFSYATLALLLGQETEALAGARKQKLPKKRELLTISMLQAAAGEDFAEPLQEYGEANSGVPVAVLRPLQTFHSALKAVHHRDRDAAALVLPDLMTDTSQSSCHRPFLFFFIRARLRLLTNDYVGAAGDFKTAIIDNRNLASPLFTTTAMPLLEHLSHFYLGQIYEKTGERDNAIGEYQKFLTPYAKSTSHLPQLAEARASLKRLHAPNR